MNLKSVYRKFLQISTSIFGVVFTKKLDARIRFKRKINLKNPVTLADKLCYMEIFIENPLKIRCSDKYEVRSYVEEKGLSELLVPLCGGVFTLT